MTVEDEVEKPQLVVQLKDAIRLVCPNKAKKARRVAFCDGIKSCCLNCDKSHMKDLGCENLKEICVNTLQECDSRVPEAATPMPVTAASRMSARMFSKMIVTGSLMPVAQRSELETRLGKFEVLSAIVDSGATVPFMNPTTGARYDVLLGSANGTEYEIASGDTLEDLCEKRMAVLTAEGTLRGYGSRCAEVTKALQSVRALVGSGHAVCFGLGDGSEHVIINKITGETNCMRDDGVNYLQDLLIVPPEDIERVAAELAAVAASRNWTSDESASASFGRQGS